MSLSCTCVFQFILFLYEYLVWQLEIPNYTTHSHHREVFGSNAYFLTVHMNSLPHLAAAYIYYHRIKWGMFLYLPYLTLFTIGQMFIWWLPYFFQTGMWYMDADGRKLEEYKKYHLHHHQILPRFRDHAVIPDTEHTILFLLTCWTFFLSIRSLIFLLKSVNMTKKLK